MLRVVTVSWLLVIVVGGGARNGNDLHPKNAKERIINGELAQGGQYPWLAALLGYADGSEENYLMNQFCGGALIAENWILTATHCIEDFQNVDDLSVLIGATSLSSWFRERFTYNGVEYRPQWRSVSAIYAHPVSDLALLELSESSDLPLLRYTSNTPSPGTLAENMGWGDTDITDEGTEHPEELYYISLPIVSDTECEARLSEFGLSLFDNREEICAGYEEAGYAPCQGDSGGPLIVESQNDGEWEVVGVVSWGPGCGGPGTVDVYADVTALTDYIDSIISGEHNNDNDGDNNDGDTEQTVSVVSNSWCDSDLNLRIDQYDSIVSCWNNCYTQYPTQLVAVDYWPNGDCWCQSSCSCIHPVVGATTLGLSAQVLSASECDALPADDDYNNQEDEDEDEDEDEVDGSDRSNGSSSSKKSSDDSGVIIGSVVGVVLFLIIVSCIICCVCWGRTDKTTHDHRELPNEEDAAPVAVIQAPKNAKERVQVTIPPGAVVGQTLHVQLPNSRQGSRTAAVQVPPGARPGSVLTFEIPASAPTQSNPPQTTPEAVVIEASAPPTTSAYLAA